MKVRWPDLSVTWLQTGGLCFQVIQHLVAFFELQDVELLPDGTLNGSNTHVIMGGWRNKISEPMMRASGMHYLQTWNESITHWNGHMPGECSHFCGPGTYQIWVWQLWALLRDIMPPSER